RFAEIRTEVSGNVRACRKFQRSARGGEIYGKECGKHWQNDRSDLRDGRRRVPHAERHLSDRKRSVVECGGKIAVHLSGLRNRRFPFRVEPEFCRAADRKENSS